MSKFIGNPIVAMNLVSGDTSYKMEIGTVIDSITVEHPYEDVVYENATIVAMSLAQRVGINNTGKILDGIPTKWYQGDDLANIRNAADYFVVDAIKVEIAPAEDAPEGTAPETHIIPISKIKEITGSYESADGEETTGTDAEGAAAAISGAADKSTVAVGTGKVAEPVTVSTGTKVTGANAGEPQNKKQEV